MLGLSLHSFAESINITDKQGRAIPANVLSCDAYHVEFLRQSDSKKFKVPLASLDEKTCSALEAWVGEGGNLVTKFEVVVNTGKTGRTSEMEDFDDKRVNLKPVVTVKNPDANKETRPLKLTVLFLGKPVTDRSSIYVFQTKTFDLPKIAPLRSQEFQMKAISSAYDDSAYAKFGYRYLGYVWIIHNEEQDEIFGCSSIPSAMVGDRAKQFLQLEEETTYDRDLKGL